jgi:hypothetical protein
MCALYCALSALDFTEARGCSKMSEKVKEGFGIGSRIQRPIKKTLLK